MMFISDNRDKIRQIVHNIFEEAFNNDIACLIDSRIDYYELDCYARELRAIENHKQFHDVIIFVMQRIYSDNRQDKEAFLTRGIFIIDNFCPNSAKDGYESLYCDILRNIISAFELMTIFIEGVKYYEQYNLIENICRKYIDPFDFELKKAVVEQIVDEYSEYLRDEVVQSPGNYSRHIPGVVKEAINGYNNFLEWIGR